MGAANVEPAPLRVDEPDPDDPGLAELLLHAAPASMMPTAATPAAALRETAPRKTAPRKTILMTAPPGLTAPVLIALIAG
jgi:hypothetical protein